MKMILITIPAIIAPTTTTPTKALITTTQTISPTTTTPITTTSTTTLTIIMANFVRL